MKVVIVNCFHWIGYHLVEILIEEGIEVIGIHESDTHQSEFLSMLVARNSLFAREDTIPDKVDISIVIGPTPIIPLTFLTIQLIENKIKTCDVLPNGYSIKFPLLYGEWMPMDEKGIYVQNKYILYTSEEFMTEAVYVQDYIRSLIAVIQEKIALYSNKKSFPLEELILENDSYIRDNSTKRKTIEQLQEHYKRHQLFYME